MVDERRAGMPRERGDRAVVRTLRRLDRAAMRRALRQRRAPTRRIGVGADLGFDAIQMVVGFGIHCVLLLRERPAAAAGPARARPSPWAPSGMMPYERAVPISISA